MEEKGEMITLLCLSRLTEESQETEARRVSAFPLHSSLCLPMFSKFCIFSSVMILPLFLSE